MTDVPYKSLAPSLTDVIGGQIQVLLNNMISTVPHLKSNRLCALATTGARRSSALADLPTIAESGLPDYENSSWSAVGVTPGTPKPIVARLHKEFSDILKLPDIQQKQAEVGANRWRHAGTVSRLSEGRGREIREADEDCGDTGGGRLRTHRVAVHYLIAPTMAYVSEVRHIERGIRSCW